MRVIKQHLETACATPVFYSHSASSACVLAGETRQIIIPGAEGYGAQGFPAWGIPPNGTLDFTLEVLKIA